MRCPISKAHIPYPYVDPLISVPLAAYGPQAINQPQMLSPVLELASARVALPLDLAEGPIYVNAKQYHGILRRRQLRAKLEAQKKLVKNRKPYLHESRHRHALNRVRGSGGRFLSTKQLQKSDTVKVTSVHSQSDPIKIFQKHNASESESHPSRANKNASSIASCSDMGEASQCNGVVTFGGTQQHASVVR